jgi:hypothetical protein
MALIFLRSQVMTSIPYQLSEVAFVFKGGVQWCIQHTRRVEWQNYTLDAKDSVTVR